MLDLDRPLPDVDQISQHQPDPADPSSFTYDAPEGVAPCVSHTEPNSIAPPADSTSTTLCPHQPSALLTLPAPLNDLEVESYNISTPYNVVPEPTPYPFPLNAGSAEDAQPEVLQPSPQHFYPFTNAALPLTTDAGPNFPFDPLYLEHANAYQAQLPIQQIGSVPTTADVTAPYLPTPTTDMPTASFTTLLTPMPSSTSTIPSPASYPCLSSTQKSPPPPLIFDHHTSSTSAYGPDFQYGGPITPITPLPPVAGSDWGCDSFASIATPSNTGVGLGMGSYKAPPPPREHATSTSATVPPYAMGGSSALYDTAPYASQSTTYSHSNTSPTWPAQQAGPMIWVYVGPDGRTYTCDPYTSSSTNPYSATPISDGRPATADQVYPTTSAFSYATAPRRSVDGMDPRLQEQLHHRNQLQRDKSRSSKKRSRAASSAVSAKSARKRSATMPQISAAAAAPATAAADADPPHTVREEDRVALAGEELRQSTEIAVKEPPRSIGQPAPTVSFNRDHVIKYGDIPHEDAKWVVCRDGLLRKIEWTTLAGAKGDQVFRQCANCRLRTTDNFRICKQNPDQVVCNQCGLWQQFNGTSRPVFRHRRYRLNKNDPKSRFSVTLAQSLPIPTTPVQGPKRNVTMPLSMPPKRLRTLDAAW